MITQHDVAGEARAALQAWRDESGHLIFTLIGFSVLVPTIAWIVGYELPATRYWFPTAVGVIALAAVALLARRLPMLVRVWLFLIILYLAAARGLIWYTGAMARVWLVGAPVLALILAGPRSGLVASAISVALVILHAAGAFTGATEGWRVTGFDENSARVVVSRAVMWLAFIVPLLALVRKWYAFQLRTLAAERAASARLEERNAERAAALESLSREVSERERLEREIARAGDEERRRLGHDLHDGVSQQLAAALLHCTTLEEHLVSNSCSGVTEARRLRELLEASMDEVHEVAKSLAPLEMDPDALGAALTALARRAGESFGVRCDYRERGDVRLQDSEQTLHLYRIAQEAVNNAGKHAAARRIALTLAQQDGHLRLTVEDDGKGLQPCDHSAGLGLRIMAFRAQRIGGTLTIEPAAQGGTRVVCLIPKGDAGAS